MAVDFGDHASGFRHYEVIRFVNNEVLMNGGGPDFYMAFRSHPWTEVEDRLQAVLVDPQVPRSLKLACAWSALALGVRAAERQREQQARRYRRLQDRFEECEAASWALAADLKRMQEERDAAVAQLCYTQTVLQQTLSERDLLHHRLIQIEQASQIVHPVYDIWPALRADQPYGPVTCPLAIDQQTGVMAMGANGRLVIDTQVQPPTTIVYMPGPQNPWVQTIQQPFQVPVTYPVYPQVGLPFLPPPQSALLMGAEAAAAPLLQSPLETGPPYPVFAVDSQVEDLHTGNIQEAAAELVQQPVPPENNGSLSQEELLDVVQETSSEESSGSSNLEENSALSPDMHHIEDNANQTHEDLRNFHGVVSGGDTESCTQEEMSEEIQEKTPLGDKREQIQKRVKRSQEMLPLNDGWRKNQQEGLEQVQGMAPMEFSASLGQQKSAEEAQAMASLKGISTCDIQESSMERLARFQMVRWLNGKEAPESQPALGHHPANWDCPWCNTNNFSGRTSCFKCKRAFVPAESKELDPGESH